MQPTRVRISERVARRQRAIDEPRWIGSPGAMPSWVDAAGDIRPTGVAASAVRGRHAFQSRLGSMMGRSSEHQRDVSERSRTAVPVASWILTADFAPSCSAIHPVGIVNDSARSHVDGSVR
jgi:hypothetical protein